MRPRCGAAAVVLALAAASAGAARAQQPTAPPPPDTAPRRAEPAPRPAQPGRADTASQGPALRAGAGPVRPDTARPARGDSVRPVSPVTPGGAFLRSLAIPGWGQARVGRNVTGGLFLAFEGVAIAMVWKANWQLEWARTRGKFVASHRQEREDWIVLLVFNHLMAGAEAYVSALLYDFPAALKVERLPGGGTGIGVSVPLR